MAAFNVSTGTGSAYQAQVVTDGAISRWKLDETTGTTLVDDIGAKNATLGGSAGTDYVLAQDPLIGTTGKSVRFNGTTTSGTSIVSANNPFNGLTSFSVEFWINQRLTLPSSGSPDASRYLFASYTGFNGILIYADNQPKITVQINNTAGTGWAYTQNSALIPNRNNHIVVTCDGTAVKIYVNGRVTSTLTTNYVASSGNNLYFGNNGATSNRFNGLMDEVAIYNTVLTQSQIINHYNLGGDNVGAGDVVQTAGTKVTNSRSINQELPIRDEKYNPVYSPRGIVASGGSSTWSSYIGGNSVTVTSNVADGPTSDLTTCASLSGAPTVAYNSMVISPQYGDSTVGTVALSTLQSYYHRTNPGQIVTCGAWFKGDTTQGTVNIDLYFRKADGTWSLANAGTAVTVTANTWIYLTHSYVAPAGAEWSTFYVKWNSINTNTYNAKVTGATIVNDTKPMSFFDGNTSGARWTGTVNNSPSYLPVARAVLDKRTRVIGDGKNYQSIVAADPGIIARWTFDEPGGYDAYDDIGGRKGTFTGTEGTHFVRNQRSLIGSGNGSSVKIGNNTLTTNGKLTISGTSNPLVGLTTFSVEFLFRLDRGSNPLGNGTTPLLNCEQSLSGTKGFLIYTSGLPLNQALQSTSVEMANGTTYVYPANATATSSPGSQLKYISSGQIFHYVMTFDGTNVYTYLNGVQATSGTNAAYVPPTSAQPLEIGVWNNQTWQGLIDELAIYNRVLSPQDVMAHYTAAGEFIQANDYPRQLLRQGKTVNQEVIGTDERVLRVVNPAARSSVTIGAFPSGGTSTTNFADGPGGQLTTCYRYVQSSSGGAQLVGLQGTDPSSSLTQANLATIRAAGWVPVSPNSQISVSFYAKIDASSTSIQPNIYFRTADGVWVANKLGTSRSLTANQWLFVSDVISVPAGAEWAMLWPQFNGLTTGNAYDFRITGQLVESGGTIQSYFDGSSTGARWLGTANQSASAFPLATKTQAIPRTTRDRPQADDEILNLITNPNVEVSANGWSEVLYVGAGAFQSSSSQRITTDSYNGTASFQATLTNSQTTNPYFEFSAGNLSEPITPGMRLYIRMAVKISGLASPVSLRMTVYPFSTGYITATVSPDTWTVMEGYFTVPFTATPVPNARGIYVSLNQSIAIGQTITITGDAAMMAINPPYTPGYFDGSTNVPSTHWLGTAHSSRSGLTLSSKTQGIPRTTGLATNYQSTVRKETGLVARWKLDETSGTTATDDVGGYNGTYNGSPTLNQSPITPGVGSSVSFASNSNTKYVSVPYNANIHPSVCTYEVWIKPGLASATGYQTQAILTSRGSPSGGFQLAIGSSPANSSSFVIPNSQPSKFNVGVTWYNGSTVVANGLGWYGSGTVTPSTSVYTGGRYHVVFTYDGTTGCIYLNGKLIGSYTGAYTPGQGALWMARDVGNSNYPYQGSIDEVAVYNVALSPQQILNHYIQGSGDLGVNGESTDRNNQALARSAFNEYSGPANDETINYCTNPLPANATGFTNGGIALFPTIGYSNGAVTMTTPSNTDTVQNSGQGSKMGIPGSVPVGMGKIVASMVITSDIAADVYIDITDNSKEGYSGTDANGLGYRKQYLTAGVPTTITWTTFNRTGLAKSCYIGSFTPNATFSIQNITFGYAPSPMTYFDGSSYGSRWLGTANASRSAKLLASRDALRFARTIDPPDIVKYVDRILTDGGAIRNYIRNPEFPDPAFVNDLPPFGAGRYIDMSRLIQDPKDRSKTTDEADRAAMLFDRALYEFVRRQPPNDRPEDVADRLIAVERAVQDIISFIDSGSRSSMSQMRFVSDFAFDLTKLSDYVNWNVAQYRNASDSITIQDLADRIQSAIRAVADSIVFNDEIYLLLIKYIESFGYMYANEDRSIKYLFSDNELEVSPVSDTEFVLHAKRKAQSNKR